MGKTFHWRYIENSRPLQLLLEILKNAPGPMTGMDIQLEAQRRGTWIANPSTCVNEIGMNPGYAVSDGVRFPDGKYRYWLISAPGWVNTAVRSSECGVRSERQTIHTAKTEPEVSVTASAQPCISLECKTCGKDLPADHQGPPFCGPQCRSDFFRVAKSTVKEAGHGDGSAGREIGAPG